MIYIWCVLYMFICILCIIHIFIFIHFVHISAAMGWVLSVGAAQPLPMETWYIHKCTIYILIFTCTSYISIQICKYIHAHIDLNWHPCFKLPQYQGFQTCAANRVWLWCKEAEISAMLRSCPGFPSLHTVKMPKRVIATWHSLLWSSAGLFPHQFLCEISFPLQCSIRRLQWFDHLSIALYLSFRTLGWYVLMFAAQEWRNLPNIVPLASAPDASLSCGSVWAAPLWIPPQPWDSPGPTSGEVDLVEAWSALNMAPSAQRKREEID